jgi:hypothetical protein
MEIFMILGGLCQKKQSQSAGLTKSPQAIPIPMYENRDEAATQGKLKKQSQFAGAVNRR